MRVTGWLCMGLLALAACDTALPPPTETPAQTPSVAATRPPPAQAMPSARSQELSLYYARLQNDLLNRGLLRVDGGGSDTPYNERDLARNFEKIVFYDEYAQDGLFQPSDGKARGLRKWTGPVRMNVEFGASVPATVRATDTAEVRNYALRLGRITQHPITFSGEKANFIVLIAGEDDREQVLQRIQQIEPGVNAATLQMIRTLPRSIHCVVAAFAAKPEDNVYSHAIAVIRAEHPDLTRKACIHEELAQGLGLANDSPAARPSIFNDDDEFALLTTHDEILLRTLYDPRLRPGMGPQEAMPIVRDIIAGLLPGPV